MMKETAASPMMDEDGEIPQHEVESAAHHMMMAEKHKSNPKMMKKIHEHMNGQMHAIKSIQDIKNARNESFKKSGKEGYPAADKKPSGTTSMGDSDLD